DGARHPCSIGRRAEIAIVERDTERLGGRCMSRSIPLGLSIVCLAIFSPVGPSAGESTPCVDGRGVVCPPQTYKDAASGLLFYVESDGRHVTAINSEGKILWTRNPFEDARLTPYRNPFPRIIYIGPATDWTPPNKTEQFFFIRFDSSQSGM